MPHPHGAFSLDDVRDVVFHTDAAGLWVYLNRAWTDVTGFAVEDSLGRPFFDWVHPDDRERNLALFGPLIRREKDHCLHQVRYLTRDGGFRWIEVHARLTLDDRDQATGTTGTLRDVTEQRREHVELEESRERLALALQAARASGWQYDVARDQLTTIAGVGPDDWPRPGHPVSAADWRERVHPEDAAAAWSAVQEVLSGRRAEYDSKYRIRGGGAWRWLRSRGRVSSRDAAGRPLLMIGTAVDISEVHELQERLLEATRLASVGTLAAGVAHEINNPLSWVVNNLEALGEQLDGAGVAAPAPGQEPPGRLAQEALHGARRIADVVRSMRALGRPDHREELRCIDVAAELSGALKMVRNQLVQRARLVVDVPAGLPAVQGRTSELGRAFLNILVNAAQAIPEGQAERHVITVRARPVAGEVLVEVTDTGVGMAPEVQRRIFEPFFTTKDVGQGSGLGLSIARSAVEAAGGRIEAVSEGGRGATFRVRLPAATGAPAAPAPEPAPALPTAGADRRPRVVVVDDEPLVRRALERTLRGRCVVTGLDTPEQVLARLDGGERWDVILCDVMMPGMDGIALHDALAARHPELLSRLAFLTGGAFGERATAFLQAHPFPVLEKPLEPEPLWALVEAMTAAGQTERANRAEPA